MKFGEKFQEPWPISTLPINEFARKLLAECVNVEKPKGIESKLTQIVKNSKEFPIEFPTNSCRIMSQPKHRHSILQQQIESVYPVLHERALLLSLVFLEHKRVHGNSIELAIYSGMSLIDFIDRLLNKRCVCFFAGQDHYLWINGFESVGGHLRVGTVDEKWPLLLSNVLSYDENKISAFLSVSSHTEFINNGHRTNYAVVEADKSKIETDGVIVGYIGAFLQRPQLMDYQDIIISPTQNTPQNGYGDNANKAENRDKDYRRIWKNFYDEKDFLYAAIPKDKKRFMPLGKTKAIFDNLLMKKRYTISIDTLLLESEARAAAAGKQAYIHVVGIGLGVWLVAQQQEEIFLETFGQRLKVLVDKLPHVSVAHFAWFHTTECEEFKNGDLIKGAHHPNGGIRTLVSRRNPADKMVPEYENMLLVVSYASNGKALPGNEFWLKSLGNSNDSATASSTLVAELHNAHINKEMVSGRNLHIASEEFGVLHVADYARKILQKRKKKN